MTSFIYVFIQLIFKKGGLDLWMVRARRDPDPLQPKSLIY